MNLPTGFLALRERFLARLPERLERMRVQMAALAVGDLTALSELKREAHSLVGAAGLHEMTELARAASQLEELANTQAGLDILEKAINKIADTIKGQHSHSAPVAEADNSRAAIALLFQGKEEMASLAALLGGAGYGVTQYDTIDNFKRAIAANERPDLLLLGLQFNGDNQAGVEFLCQLRADLLSTLPVLVLSASHSIERGMAAYKAGADRVLAKPISAEALLHHVSDTLAARKIPLRTLLAVGAAQGKFAQFIADMSAPLLCFEFCSDPRDIPARLSAASVDAIILDDSANNAEPTLALDQLLQDYPQSAHLPIIVFTDGHDEQQRAKAWAAGSAAVIDAGLAASEFAAMVRSLCRTAERGRKDVDAAERQQYENARQRLALDHHAIISLADASGTIFNTSPRHDALTGFARTELIGSHLSEYRRGLAPPELNAEILLQVRNGRVWQGEYQLPCKCDETRWVQTTLVPFLDQHGSPYQYMVIRNDITDRKRSEQALLGASARETMLAAQIQETLLLPPLPTSIGSIPVASRYRASAGVAGDFHALIQIGPDTFDLLIGDVMGKGVPAALIGAAVKMELSQSLLELRANGTDIAAPQPKAIIEALDRRLTSRLIELECFVTLAYVRFDRQHQTLTSVGCGHPEILVFAQDSIQEIPNQHPPLGTIVNEIYTQTTTPWLKGSLVLLYSDGLSETCNNRGQMLDVSGLKRITCEAMTDYSHPDQIARLIMDATECFAAGSHPEDDRTLVAVRLPADNEHFIDLPNHVGAITRLREFILTSCPPGLALDETDRIVLASVEAFTNIVRHAELISGKIRILLKYDQSRLTLSMHYDGQSFTLPPNTTLPDAEELKEGGYGLPLIHALCDEFTCGYTLGANTNHLVFHVATSG
ncbi:MAG: SpoIIE family protein phosphatase [Pseudohongiella sp.]|nr:SpoIIE family protein phosphatase [Pseudohongiella sp.]